MAGRGLKRTASKRGKPDPSAGPSGAKKKKNVTTLGVPTLPTRLYAVMTTGQNDVGQLGHGSNVVELTKFKFVKDLGTQIVDAVAGAMHTVALDKDGKVWTFGCNDEGALGRITEDDDVAAKPTAINLPRPAVAISAGDSHTAAILDNGDVYAWGSFRDSKGSMGLILRGREGQSTKEPVHIVVGEPAAAIASGSDHLVILTISHSVYTMGNGEQGQLGRISQRSANRDSRQGLAPLLVPSKVTLKPVSKIWAGHHGTFALDASGDKMYAWGLNNYGQLGIRPSRSKRSVELAPHDCDAFAVSTRWKEVACGQHHTLALDGEGHVYAIGRAEYGMLGLGPREGEAEHLERIESLAECVSISAGTANSLAVTQSGEPFCWGMGSEGLLGTGRTSDEHNPARCNLVKWLDSTIEARKGSTCGQHTLILVEIQVSKGVKESAETAAEIEPKASASKGKAKGRGGKRSKLTATVTSATAAHDEDQVCTTSVPDTPPPPPPTAAADTQKESSKSEKEEGNAMEVDETDGAGPSTVTKEADNGAAAVPATEKPPEELAAPTPESMQSMESIDDVEMQEPAGPTEAVQSTSGANDDVVYPRAEDIPNEIVNHLHEGIDDLIYNNDSSQGPFEESSSQDTDKSEDVPVAAAAPTGQAPADNVNGEPEHNGQPDMRHRRDAAVVDPAGN